MYSDYPKATYNKGGRTIENVHDICVVAIKRYSKRIVILDDIKIYKPNSDIAISVYVECLNLDINGRIRARVIVDGQEFYSSMTLTKDDRRYIKWIIKKELVSQ